MYPAEAATKLPPTIIDKVMETFWDWLKLQSLLAEAWYSFNSAQYNELFDNELEKVIRRVSDPTHRQALERMQRFDWTG